MYIFKQGSRLCVCHWVGFPVNVCWMINECSGPEWKWAKVSDLFLLPVIPHFWRFSPYLASFFNLKTLLSIGMNVCVLWKLNWTKVPFEAELFCNIWRKYFAYDKDIDFGIFNNDIQTLSSHQAQPLSSIRLFETLWNIAHQALLSMRLSQQEYWSELPFPPPEDLSDPGIKPNNPSLLRWQAVSLPPSHLRSLHTNSVHRINFFAYHLFTM